MTLQVCATDWDFTLLRSDRTLSPTTIATLDRFRATQATLVVVSGRPVSGVRYSAVKCGFDAHDLPVVGLNGAELQVHSDSELVTVGGLPAALAFEILETISGTGLGVYLMDGNVLYASHPGSEFADLNQRETGQLVRALHELPDAGITAGKMMVAGDPGQLRRTEPALREHLGGAAELAYSENVCLDLMPPGIDKGRGLTALSTLMGFSMDSVLAIGDNHNDIPMIRAAAVGVAVANAVPQLRSIAHYIAPSNDDDGVADTIRRYFEQPQ